MGEEQINRRGWSDRRQWRTIFVFAAVLAAIIAALWFGGKVLRPHESSIAEPSSPPGTFRASASQLKTFTIEAVQPHAFVSEELTEGKSRSTGSRDAGGLALFRARHSNHRGTGRYRKAGATLATIEASEFVQAQNDLNVAAAQAKLARINETRRHALYDAKGGSLQDWQQAQADLTAAETVLSSVRNRLQIFGKSPADIAKLEASQTTSPVAALTAPIAGVVVDRQVGPGQYLQSGGAPVFTIADPSSVWLLANVRETDARWSNWGSRLKCMYRRTRSVPSRPVLPTWRAPRFCDPPIVGAC